MPTNALRHRMCLSLVRRLVCCALALAFCLFVSAYYAYTTASRAFDAHPDAARLLAAMRHAPTDDIVRVAARFH